MNSSLPKVPEARQQAIRKKTRQEYASEISALKQRADYVPQYDYFLDILALHAEPEKFKQVINKPVVAMNCLQAPPEIFDALGFIPYRFCSNALSRQDLAASRLPTLACPVIKSCLSSFSLDDSIERMAELTVIAGTCDWMARLPELIDGRAKNVHFMELPHMKESERGRKRWIEEVYLLKDALEKVSGKKMLRQKLRLSMEKFAAARLALRHLLDARSRKEIPVIWCLIMTNAFSMGDVDGWTDRVNDVIRKHAGQQHCAGASVFLAGSPVMFPNLKISKLLETAGIDVVADELCTSERILGGVPSYEDDSEYAMLKALAEQSHLGCSCPTYADNNRRLDNILEIMRARNISGLVLHILKGCHPYDMCSFQMEQVLRKNGFHFLRIETDQSREDNKSLLLRLEAFSAVIQ
jgi:benzoyl-CoA reductase/2-hydroxyglutaryl-CoA dehydratase subunit BcrC/BadD/HgdB